MRILYLLQTSLLFLSLSAKAMSGEEAILLAGANHGTIMSINLEENKIQIDQISYPLAQNLSVYSPQNLLASKILLENGQKIDYWTGTDQEGDKVISRIKIMTQFNKNAYNR